MATTTPRNTTCRAPIPVSNDDDGGGGRRRRQSAWGADDLRPEVDYRRPDETFESRLTDCLVRSAHGYERATSAISYAGRGMKLSLADCHQQTDDMLAAGDTISWTQNRMWKSLWRIETAVAEDSQFRRLLSEGITKYVEGGVCDASIAPRDEVVRYVTERVRLSEREFDACLDILDYGHKRGSITAYAMIERHPILSDTIRSEIDLPPPEHDDDVFALPDVDTPIWVRSELSEGAEHIPKLISDIRRESEEHAKLDWRKVRARRERREREEEKVDEE